MENNEYYFCIEDFELDSFLSFCEVNNISFDDYRGFPLGETTFVLKNNKISLKLSDDDFRYNWDDFIGEYYSDLFRVFSIKEIINKLKSDKYSFDGVNFKYGNLELFYENILGCCDDTACDLLEIIFESNTPIGHPEKPTVESKSYLDFNPLN